MFEHYIICIEYAVHVSALYLRQHGMHRAELESDGGAYTVRRDDPHNKADDAS